jgi:hypothetical protein
MAALRYSAAARPIRFDARDRPRPCKNAKVVYIEESDFFEAAT